MNSAQKCISNLRYFNIISVDSCQITPILTKQYCPHISENEPMKTEITKLKSYDAALNKRNASDNFSSK